MATKITVLCDADDCTKIDKETKSFCTGGPDSEIHISISRCKDYVMNNAYLDAQLKEIISKRIATTRDYTREPYASIERITTREELDNIIDGKRVKNNEAE